MLSGKLAPHLCSPRQESTSGRAPLRPDCPLLLPHLSLPWKRIWFQFKSKKREQDEASCSPLEQLPRAHLMRFPEASMPNSSSVHSCDSSSIRAAMRMGYVSEPSRPAGMGAPQKSDPMPTCSTPDTLRMWLICSKRCSSHRVVTRLESYMYLGASLFSQH